MTKIWCVSEEELHGRVVRARAGARAAGFDALLLFSQGWLRRNKIRLQMALTDTGGAQQV